MSDLQTRSFKDSEGRLWVVRVTVAVTNRVRTAEGLDFDLMNLADQKHLERIITDPGLFVSVLYEVLRPKVEEREITPEAFAEIFYGDVLSDALDALMKAVADFFPSARQRENLLKIWDAAKRASESAQEMLGKRIELETSDEKIQQMCEKALGGALPASAGTKSADAPPSSE
jgi:translation elongation factor EF-G